MGVCSAKKLEYYAKTDNRQNYKGGRDLIVQFWDQEHHFQKEYLEHVNTKFHFQASIDSKDRKLFACYFQEAIHIWEVNHIQDTFCRLTGFKSHAFRLLFSEDNTKLISCCDKHILVWDIASSSIIRTIEYSSWVGGLEIIGDHLYTASNDKTIRIWELNDGKQLKLWNDKVATQVLVVINKDCIACLQISNLILRNSRNGIILRKLLGKDNFIINVTIPADHNLVITTDSDKYDKQWIIAKLPKTQTIEVWDDIHLMLEYKQQWSLIVDQSKNAIHIWNRQ